MKKLLTTLCAVLALVLAVAFAGCAQNGTSNTENTQKKTIAGVWDCISLTEETDDQSYTTPVPAEVCVLTVNENGTFRATTTYANETDDLVSGNWSQNGNTVTLSNIVHGVASNDDGAWSIIITDDDHITLQYEAEIGTGAEEFSSYNLQRKN